HPIFYGALNGLLGRLALLLPVERPVLNVVSDLVRFAGAGGVAVLEVADDYRVGPTAGAVHGDERVAAEAAGGRLLVGAAVACEADLVLQERDRGLHPTPHLRDLLVVAVGAYGPALELVRDQQHDTRHGRRDEELEHGDAFATPSHQRTTVDALNAALPGPVMITSICLATALATLELRQTMLPPLSSQGRTSTTHSNASAGIPERHDSPRTGALTYRENSRCSCSSLCARFAISCERT